MFKWAKRLVVGQPLRSERLGETLLPKKLALPVFCSDPLSSNAYATEEILRALSLGGLALLFLTPWIAASVAVLLAVVVASYRQTCHAYPTGGGAYAVSRANLGRNAALVAASALLVDYVLTVAVSVAAGVDAITSAFLTLKPAAVLICLFFVAVLTLVNLRGIKESGTVFAVPTYGFIAVLFLMIGWGLWRTSSGHAPQAESASFGIAPVHSAAGVAVLLLALRAFSQGCTALTGVEAVSNGVPNFKAPKSRNAANTITIMGGITIAMFAGVTALALIAHVRVADDPAQLIGAPAGYEQRTAIAQIAGAVFGYGTAGFLLVQAFTAAILILAANTAFNGFPILASILGHDGYLPKQFARRGDRLVFSNGIVILAALAGLLIWVFDASTSRLIQLYIIGVFVSFTLSQTGMVRHWTTALQVTRDPAGRRRLHRSRLINGVGAALTGVVLVVVLITKFTHGAYLVVIAMPAIFALMKAIERHYRRVGAELEPDPGGMVLPSRIHAVVLVSRLHKPTLRALAYARATRPDTLTALTVAGSPEDVRALQGEWAQRGIPVTLTELEAPYRDITGPVLDYVADLRRRHPRDLVVIYLPEYVVGHWWEHLLHNQSALRLKARLLFQRGVMVTSVPWQLTSSRADERVPQQPTPAAPEPAGVGGRITEQ
ncbi:amino acid/polyamine/organocation transporter, APC superfamily [Micromonospora pattaloongensis]|uniref:Amino acid/polyamine/organocation transporter, APC superfamily n=1 Tax=Micromonospora pattaloongensis TaxID=405436 RepID=A0A1H3P5C0_9ACTN|nr:APC family permease [Micromonospora pattaloongensis]SDY96302.1 amino acid/polyamine/organocation transporter, APC superfamily [Micromonospora pattaloongensis]